jgi:hypothetical protein
MKPREVFGIVVRTIGLIVVLYGIVLLIYVIVRTLGIAVDAKSSVAAEAIFGIIYAVVRCALIFRATFLVRTAYASDENSD